MENNTNVSNVLNSLFKGMEGFLSTKTVVGDVTQIGDTYIVPLVSISFGVGAGAGFGNTANGGGGGGIHGKMNPYAVLIIRPDGTTKLVDCNNSNNLTKIIDAVPDVIDKVKSMLNKDEEEEVTDDEAKEAAFSDKE